MPTKFGSFASSRLSRFRSEELPLLVAHVERRNDVRMADARCEARLVEEHADEIRVLRELALEPLPIGRAPPARSPRRASKRRSDGGRAMRGAPRRGACRRNSGPSRARA